MQLVADDLGFFRLVEEAEIVLRTDSTGFIRFDATAGKKNCTPGKTIPCGNVCRQPANCKKKSVSTEPTPETKPATTAKGRSRTKNTVVQEEKPATTASKRTRKPVTAAQDQTVGTAKTRTKKTTTRTSSDKKPTGKTPKDYDSFRETLAGALQSVNNDYNQDGLVSLSKLRNHFGSSLSKEKFDELLKEANKKGDITLTGGNEKRASKEELDGSIRTSMGDTKLYAKFDPETFKPSTEQKSKKSKAENAIPSYKGFEQETMRTFEDLNKKLGADGMVPIYRLRRELGDRVTRSQFNDWLKKMVASDQLEFTGGSIEDGAKDKIEDSITTAVSGVRTYVRKPSR